MHSPLRSESDFFAGVVMAGIAAALVVLLAVLVSTAAAAIVAAASVGVAIGLLWRHARGSMPDRVEVATQRDSTHRVLVVANETIEGEALLAEIENRTAGKREVEILLVCPALAGSRLQHLASDIDGPREEAEARMHRSLAALREIHPDVAGSVGDDDPFAATRDALATFAADELIVSTHPPERSRWLERGVIEQIRRDVDLPLTHVIVEGAGGRVQEVSTAAA